MHITSLIIADIQPYIITDLSAFQKHILSNTALSNNGCWIWQLSKDKDGYGYNSTLTNKGFSRRSHRASYQAFKGTIPKSWFVCHSCDNPSCCNPLHIWIGTSKENNHDMISKRRNKHPGGIQGSNNTSSILTEKDVVIIRSSTLSRYDLAKKYNVSYALIRSVQCYEVWRHVP